MLTPEYLEQCPDRLVTIYEQAERDIIADMARKIREYDYFCSSAEWQAKKLQEMGISRKEILKRLSAATGKTKAELTKLLKEAGVKTLRDDGVKPTQAAIYALNAGLRRTSGTFDNLTRTTAVNGTRQIVEALDRVYAQVTSGAFSPRNRDQKRGYRNWRKTELRPIVIQAVPTTLTLWSDAL